MDLPTPPTDNLYKFQALSGIVSIILLFWLITAKYDELSVETIKCVSENFTFTNRMKDLVLEKQELIKSTGTNDNGQVQSIVNKRLEELLGKFEGVNNRNEIAKYHLSQLRTLLYLSGGLLVLLIVYTLIGFWKWYYRVQVYQDMILKNEAESISKKKRPN